MCHVLTVNPGFSTATEDPENSARGRLGGFWQAGDHFGRKTFGHGQNLAGSAHSRPTSGAIFGGPSHGEKG